MNIFRTLPENVIWESLGTAHAHLAVGSNRVRRYPRGYPPVVGFADPDAPDFDALAELCEIGEVLMGVVTTYSTGRKFQIVEDTFADLMTLSEAKLSIVATRDSILAPHLQCATLGAEDGEEVQSLVTKTNPGPFSPKALELGRFYGIRDRGRLAAVAGTRFHLPYFREIATVCTDAEYEGQGLARHLLGLLISDIARAGKTPFLHVLDHHERAFHLYKNIGFVTVKRLPVKALKRVA